MSKLPSPTPPTTCEYCGPVCYKGAAHNARVEDGAKWDPTPPTETQPLSMTQKMRGRPVTHDEASISAQRLINSHFNNSDRARCSIPARAGDDDLVVTDYIKEQAAKDVAAPTERVETSLELELDLSQEIRLELWVNHQCQGKYGDDGEMQCNCFYPMIDFKRDFPSEILAKSLLHRIQLSRAAVAPSPAGESQGA